MPKKSVELLLFTISSPLKGCVYIDKILIDTFEDERMCSDGLLSLYEEISKKYNIEKIYFVRGPGSFMAIKLTYIFLKTLQITKNIEIQATDAFTFNNNSPIKGCGNLYFVKKDGNISLQKKDDIKESKYLLPEILDSSLFSDEIEPLYILPAVR